MVVSRVLRAATQPLPPAPLDPAQVISGSPQVAALDMVDDEHRILGVWEHGPGVSTDVESDEVFVVLSGRASVQVEGGPRLDLGPGDVAVLAAGDRTTWTVHETLRKVYVLPPSRSPGV